jgi:hypothetical protein
LNLHAHKVLWKNVSVRNVYIDANNVPKIAGLNVETVIVSVCMFVCLIEVYWLLLGFGFGDDCVGVISSGRLAPETLTNTFNSTTFSTKSDVYSFAALICETYYRAVCRTFHSICLKD